jgi:predicted permease
MLTHLLSDLRYAIRMALHSPGFSATVILILALGIGANTVMYTVVDHVLLRPLPYPDPERLFAVQEDVASLRQIAPELPVNANHFTTWRREWTSAEQIALMSGQVFTLTSGGEPQRFFGSRVSSSLFPLLGIQPQLGRNFLEEEDRPGRDNVVILSNSLWQRQFHGDRSILGQKIVLDGVPREVVGVLPVGARIPRQSDLDSLPGASDFDPDIWKPFAIRDSEMSLNGEYSYGALARLKPGVSAARALDELNAIQKRIAGGKADLSAVIAPLLVQTTARSRQGLLLLLAAVGAVLLIICVNLANLLLARSAVRRRELAIRAALGASRRRLLSQALVESLLLALLGGALGIMAARWSLGAVVAAAPFGLSRLNEIRLDTPILATAILLALFCGALFGLLPAWRGSRADPQEGMRGSSRSATGDRQGARTRALLVAMEAGLSTVCLVAAGLLLNSFVRLLSVDKGFEVDRVLTVSVSTPASRYPDAEKRARFFNQAVERAQQIPGVKAAGISNRIPLTGEGSNFGLIAEGHESDAQAPITDYRLISEDYLKAMGVPLRRGRFFTQTDRDRQVALVSAVTAERMWPGENPIGKHIRLGSRQSDPMEVLGVVGDVRNSTLQKAPGLTVYLPFWQRDRADYTLAVRTAADPSALAKAVRAELRALDSQLTVPRARTMQEILSAGVAERRFQLTLVLVFAGAALALASFGIFGVVSYTTAQRRNEMGIRLALGATASDVRGLVVRQGIAPVAAGLGAGLIVSVMLGRSMASLLYGVRAFDPVTLAVVAAVLLTVAAAACYVPAFRASRADPLAALRYE